MSFLTINGLNIPVEVGSFSIEDDDVVNFARSSAFSLDGGQYAYKRVVKFVDTPDEDVRASAVRDWVKGRGSYWTFDRVDGVTTKFNSYSTESGIGLLGGSITNSSSVKFGTWAASMNGTASATVPLTGSGRYSVSLWRLENAGSYQLCSVTYDTATIRYFVGATLTTAFSWLTHTAQSSFFSFNVSNKAATGGASIAMSIDGVMALPYSMHVSMCTARMSRTAAEPNFPYVELGGDCIEDANLTVKGFVEKQETIPVTLTTGWEYNARQTSYSLREK